LLRITYNLIFGDVSNSRHNSGYIYFVFFFLDDYKKIYFIIIITQQI
jgi:hypothetical protein